MGNPKAAPETLSDLFDRAMTGKRVEPKRRMVGGRYGYAIHRFPIKGGITLREVMAESVMTHNFRRLAGTRGEHA